MKYEIFITKSAYKQLKKLDSKAAKTIRAKLAELCEDPKAKNLDVKKLQGREGYRLRVGDYRVIYELDHGKLIVIVLQVGHRREIY